MVKYGPPLRLPNTLDVDDQMAYVVLTETWRVMEFLLYRLKSVEVADLASGDRDCSICGEPFEERHHGPVRLPCKHCFGEPCIKTWISPYAPCKAEPGEILKREPGANDCPLCRCVFFPEQTVWDSLPEIEARLELLDRAYEYIGIELTERQSRARNDVMHFVRNYPRRNIDKFFPPPDPDSTPSMARAHRSLVIICGRYWRKQLTPLQEELCQELEDIAIYGFGPLIDIDNEGRDDERYYESVECDELTEGDVVEKRLDEESEKLEEESEELAEWDTEEMRFFRIMFR
ncbi:hypothetical protein MMC07_004861 [Pseudocyphellaria aurata]|nr:hypothetical protein [Pseudocyphellaria aurata]